MKFRTEITLPRYPFHISYHDGLLFLGSCFSDHIGNYFKTLDFRCLVNPCGTLFNPLSIKQAIELALGRIPFGEHHTAFFDNRWISFAHHGKFSNPDQHLFLKNIEDSLVETRTMLENSAYLFLTFGTAYYYRHRTKDLVVANCHKIPSREFEKKRLTVSEIISEYKDLIDYLQVQYPALRIIFTVSPVRHLGDGFHENQLSKSILHLAVDELVDARRVFYFPAYEIVQDDLRDYRFYAKDLCHPGESAIDYLKEKLETVFFTEETLLKIREVERANQRNGHRTNHL